MSIIFPSRGMLLRIIFFYWYIIIPHSINVYFQHKKGESHVSSTNCVQPSSRDKCVHMAGHSLELQLRETALTRSSCPCAQVHVAWSLKTTLLARRRFLGGKRIGWCSFSWLISKHIVFSGALPVEVRKHEKVQWAPRTWPTGRNVSAGNCVLLEMGKSQTSSIGAY